MSPLKHSHFQDLLEQHISGHPLPPMQRMDLFDHLEECDECRQILEAEERITARMKSVPRLVAPADLRSKILSQAIRDHRERTTTPIEDPAVADLLKCPPISPSDQAPPAPAQTPAAAAHTRGNRADAAPAAMQETPAADSFPVFSGIAPPPPPSRLRRAWGRASPVMASGLLAMGAIAALYSGPFQGVPIAEDAQKLVWAGVHTIFDPGESDVVPSSGFFADTAVAEASPPAPSHPIAATLPDGSASNSATVAVSFASSQPAREIVDSHAAAPGPTAPLPGTDAVVDWMKRLRGWGAALDSTAAAFAQASIEEIPGPAEKAAPQIAALVLRPTDLDDGLGGFRRSALADAVESLPAVQPGCRIARQDQFALNGHRYRLYTLELPAGYARRMVHTLTPYESPADRRIVSALKSQSTVNVSARGGSLQFYSSNEAQLRSALQTVTPVAHQAPAHSEQIQVVLVE